MRQQPTSICSCEVAYCASLHVNDILYSLLRMKKGPQHVIMVEGSHTMNRKERVYRTSQLKEKVRNMELPYVLRFYKYGPALVCWWEFTDETKRPLKEWFDRQAEEGNYPDVSGMKMIKH
jgi:hypothetical protein